MTNDRLPITFPLDNISFSAIFIRVEFKGGFYFTPKFNIKI